MNKSLLLSLTAAVAAVFSAGAENQTLTLTFNRPDNTVDVAGVVTTATGIDGVTASLTAVSPSLRAQGTKGAEYATPAATLLPDRNSSQTTNETRNVWTFSLAGIPEGKTISAISITVDGLTMTGESQSTKTAQNRQVNVDALCSASGAELQKFAGISNTDLMTNGHFINAEGEEIASDGYASNEAGWAAGARRLCNTHSLTVSVSPETVANMVLQLEMWKGNNNAGCMYGLSQIVLTLSEPETEVDEVEVARYKQSRIDRLSDIHVLGDVNSIIGNVDVSAAKTTAEAKALVNEAVNAMWDALGGGVYTFQNMPCTDAHSNLYLSGRLDSDNRVTTVERARTSNEAWRLEIADHDVHNAFYVKNVATDSYLSITPVRVSGNTNNFLGVTSAENADSKAIFTLVPYTYKPNHSGAIALKCTNAANATNCYLQCPAGQYPKSEADQSLAADVTETTVNWWFNGVDPSSGFSELHPSAFKGRWLMAKAPDEIATSISEIAVETKSAEGIYDLSGRRLSVPAKGICIINGRKTLVK